MTIWFRSLTGQSWLQQPQPWGLPLPESVGCQFDFDDMKIYWTYVQVKKSNGWIVYEEWFHHSEVQVAQSCPTLCDPTYYIVHGILQARILEWAAISFSRGSSQPRDQTCVSCITDRHFTIWETSGVGGRNWLGGDLRKLFEVMEMFCILIRVWVTQMYAFVKN